MILEKEVLGVVDEIKIFNENYNGKNPRVIKYTTNENDCWICVSHTRNKAGYPVVTRRGKFYNMSRYVYEITKGEIPLNHVIMHSCDNPNCINPSHLSSGTTQENTLDMISKGRQAKGSRVGGSKLTEEKVLEIIKLLKIGITHREIAKKFGVHRSNIGYIKNKKIWSYLTEGLSF
jgi:hypothetical protein